MNLKIKDISGESLTAYTIPKPVTRWTKLIKHKDWPYEKWGYIWDEERKELKELHVSPDLQMAGETLLGSKDTNMSQHKDKRYADYVVNRDVYREKK